MLKKKEQLNNVGYIVFFPDLCKNFFVMNHGRLVHQCMNRHRRVPHELHPHGAQRKWSVLVT
jgi:hypothetical protein